MVPVWTGSHLDRWQHWLFPLKNPLSDLIIKLCIIQLALTNFKLGGDGHLNKRPTNGERKCGKTENRRVICDHEIFLYIWQVHLQLDHASSAKVYANINERFYGIKKGAVEWLSKHYQSCLLEWQNQSRASLEPSVSKWRSQPGFAQDGPGDFSWRNKPKLSILFEEFSAAFTNKVPKVRNINYILLNYSSLAIPGFHQSTRPRLVQADAGLWNHVRAGQRLAQAIRMEAGRLLTNAKPGRP